MSHASAKFATALFIATLANSVVLAQTEARMSGTVKDPDGKPVVGAIVRLDPQDERGVKVFGKTKKAGKYLIGLVRPASYRIVVEAPDDLVPLRMTGHAVDPSARRTILWEVDQEVSPASPLTVNVGPVNQIVLDFVVGPKSMTPEARREAAVEADRSDYAKAVEKVRTNDFEGALALLEPLLEKAPDHTNTHYLIAFSRERLGQYEAALTAIDRVLQLDQAYSGARGVRGRALQGLGRDDEAAAEFRREIDMTSDSATKADAQIALALLHEKAGRTAEAIQALEAAAALAPDRRNVLIKLADLYTTTGERAKAAAALERAEAAGGMDDVALLNLAIGYINDKNYVEAERLAEKLLGKGSTDPNLSVAHSVLARCDMHRGKMDDGVAHLEKAIALDPKSPLTEENRQILAALKKK